MKTVEERVAELKDRHARGYNCAQVVLCSYADVLSIDEETLFQISEGFGAGWYDGNLWCGDRNVYGTWIEKQFRGSAGMRYQATDHAFGAGAGSKIQG